MPSSPDPGGAARGLNRCPFRRWKPPPLKSQNQYNTGNKGVIARTMSPCPPEASDSTRATDRVGASRRRGRRRMIRRHAHACHGVLALIDREHPRREAAFEGARHCSSAPSARGEPRRPHTAGDPSPGPSRSETGLTQTIE